MGAEDGGKENQNAMQKSGGGKNRRPSHISMSKFVLQVYVNSSESYNKLSNYRAS